MIGYNLLLGGTWESKCDHSMFGDSTYSGSGAMTAIAGVAAAVTTMLVASF